MPNYIAHKMEGYYPISDTDQKGFDSPPNERMYLRDLRHHPYQGDIKCNNNKKINNRNIQV